VKTTYIKKKRKGDVQLCYLVVPMWHNAPAIWNNRSSCKENRSKRLRWRQQCKILFHVYALS